MLAYGDGGGKAPPLREKLKYWKRDGKNVGVVVLVRLYRVLASLVLELHWRSGDVVSREPPLEEKGKMEVESREKFLGWVTRGEDSESDVGVGVTLEVGLHRFKKC